MVLRGLVGPWSGEAYRHIPEGSPFDVLDFRFAGAGENRWNYPAQPTLYVAGDIAIALAEFARHLDNNRASGLRTALRARQLYRLHVRLERVLDLRRPDVRATLSIPDAPACFLEKAVARATAHYIRTVTTVQAIIVPSMAFLDEPDRWVGVLFLERLPAAPQAFVSSVERERVFRLEP